MTQPHDPYLPLRSLSKFVVVGGCGFVGRWLALRLAAANPRAQIVAFDVSRASGSSFAALFSDAEIDIRGERDALRAAMRRVRVVRGSISSPADLARAIAAADVVFNAAAYGMSSARGARGDLCLEVNVEGVRALVDACVRCNVKRLVHVSSVVAVFTGAAIENGTSELPLVTRAHHGGHYGHTKALAEALLRDAPAGLSVIIVRPNGIFGPNDNTHFPRLKELLRKGLFNLKVGDGRSLVDWIFIDNLTHALLMSAVSLVSQRITGCLTVHVSDEDPREMNHLFCTFAEGLGYPAPSLYISVPLLARIASIMVNASRFSGGLLVPMLTPSEAYKAGTHMVFSTHDARKYIGWAPIVTYTDGIQLTLEYEHRSILRSPPPPLEIPSIFWWLLIVGGMWLCWIGDSIAVHDSDGLCRSVTLLCRICSFGSNFTAAVGLNLAFLFYCAFFAHVIEASVALIVMCRLKRVSKEKLGKIKRFRFFDWGISLMSGYFIQTLILGYPSLKIVLRYARLQNNMINSGVMEREVKGMALM